MTLPPDAPAVHPVTEQLYDMLPEVYRVGDQYAQGTLDYPLLRYLSLIGDRLGEVVDLIDGLDVAETVADDGTISRTSALVDPATANVAYLVWLAQLAGVRLSGLESEANQRDAIINADTGWRAGTKAALAAAAQRVLGGSQYVQVYDHSTDAGPNTGGMWDVLVLTKSTETPGNQPLVDSINAMGAKPAGVLLWLGSTAISWDELQSTYPNWSALEAAGSWDVIESAGAGPGTNPTGSAPAAPAITVAPGNGQAFASWPAVTGATRYQPYLNSVLYGGPVTSTSLAISGLANGTPYSVEVRAMNAYGSSGPSNTVSVTPVAPPAAVPNPPVLRLAVGDGQLTASWSAIQGADSYQVFVDNGAGALLYGNPVSGTSEVITGLKNGTAYTVTVEAINAAGSSAPSNALQGTPQAAAPPVVGAPAAPTISSATPGVTDVQLTWGAVAGATSYQPYVNGAASGAAVAGTSVDITGLAASTTYTFTVKAISAGGTSPASAAVSTKTFAATTLLFGISNNNLSAFDSALGSPVTVVRDYTTLDSPTPAKWQTLAIGRQQVITSLKFKLNNVMVDVTTIPKHAYDSQIIAYGNFLIKYGLDGCFDHEIDAKTAAQGGTAAALNAAFMYALNLVRNLPGWNRHIYACLTGFDIVDRAPAFQQILNAADGIMLDNGYSTAATPSFDADAGPGIDYLTTNYPTQPIYITEWGSTAAAGRAAWITAAAAALKTNRYRNVKAAMYWNAADPGFDCTIAAGSAEFNAWVAAAETFTPSAAVPAPVASFTDTVTNLTAAFDGSGSSAPGSTISTYSWNYGDGSAAGSGVSPSHTYAAAGTYNVTLTVTNAAGQTNSVTQSVSVSAAAAAINFIGQAAVAGNGTTQTITIPAAVQAGDGMLLAINANLTATDNFTVPAGWTLLDTQATTMKSSVYRRVAAAGDAGSTLTVTIAGATHMNVQLVAYRGTNASNPVVAYAKSMTGSVSQSNYTTPASNVPLSGDHVISIWACKSSTVTTWTVPGTETVRSRADDPIGGGGHINSVITGGGAVPAGACGGLTATTDQAAGVLAGWTIVIGA